MIDPKYFEDSLGLPCVGRGYCCMKAQCGLSFAKYGYQNVCPALQWNGRRHIGILVKEYAAVKNGAGKWPGMIRRA
jgi:hypothetical protein